LASLEDNIPLGITTTYDQATKKTTVAWSYVEGAKINFFQLEVWDEVKRKWVPFDGHYGVVRK